MGNLWMAAGSPRSRARLVWAFSPGRRRAKWSSSFLSSVRWPRGRWPGHQRSPWAKRSATTTAPFIRATFPSRTTCAAITGNSWPWPSNRGRNCTATGTAEARVEERPHEPMAHCRRGRLAAGALPGAGGTWLLLSVDAGLGPVRLVSHGRLHDAGLPAWLALAAQETASEAARLRAAAPLDRTRRPGLEAGRGAGQ